MDHIGIVHMVENPEQTMRLLCECLAWESQRRFAAPLLKRLALRWREMINIIWCHSTCRGWHVRWRGLIVSHRLCTLWHPLCVIKCSVCWGRLNIRGTRLGVMMHSATNGAKGEALTVSNGRVWLIIRCITICGAPHLLHKLINVRG